VNLEAYVFLDAFADAGETKAMLLYKQLAADKLLIDDKRGRKVAKINQTLSRTGFAKPSATFPLRNVNCIFA
jgi:predicted nucleic acid-binding protein